MAPAARVGTSAFGDCLGGRELLGCVEKLAGDGGEEAGRASGLLQDMMPLLLR